jgi:hypothetical protein
MMEITGKNGLVLFGDEGGKFGGFFSAQPQVDDVVTVDVVDEPSSDNAVVREHDAFMDNELAHGHRLRLEDDAIHPSDVRAVPRFDMASKIELHESIPPSVYRFPVAMLCDGSYDVAGYRRAGNAARSATNP